MHNGNNCLCILFNAYFTDYPLGGRAPETYHASGPGRIMLCNTQKYKNNISGSTKTGLQN